MSTPVETAKPKRGATAKERFGSKLNPFSGERTTHAVSRSADFRRIAALPRRDHWLDVSEALTLAFALPPVAPNTCPKFCPCQQTGSMKLRPVQAWALAEFYEQRGGIGFIGVGAGKSILALLVPLLMGWERPLLLVPAALRDKALKIDIPLLSRHWQMPKNLEVRSYEELSRDTFADYLSLRRIPDGIVADEMHSLRHPTAAKTKRASRFLKEFTDTEFVGFTGSPVHRSVMDYGHLLLWGLKDKAPMPQSYVERRSWADALDEGIPEWARPDPGALMDFCLEGENVRDGYGRRLVESPGVVSSPDLSTNVGLRVMEISPVLAGGKIPKEVILAFKDLRNGGKLPEGEIATTHLDQARHARQLFLGFYLRWVWPDGKRDVEWLKKRKAWRSFVRKMTTRSHSGMWLDTEKQVADAVKAGWIVCAETELGVTGNIIRSNVNVHAEWVEIRDDRQHNRWNGQREPPKEAVWISDYMVLELERWAQENKGIVWIENPLFMDRLKERGHRCFYAGDSAIELEDGDVSVFASYAHAVGKNLQMFSRMCFANPLTSGKAWEQALGREHRAHQHADEVVADVFLGCRETWWSFTKSRYDARYIEDTIRQKQRLNMATIVATDETTVIDRCDRGDPLWAETGFARLDDPSAVLGADATPREIKRARKEGKKRAHEESYPLLTEMKKRAKALSASVARGEVAASVARGEVAASVARGEAVSGEVIEGEIVEGEIVEEEDVELRDEVEEAIESMDS